MIAGFSINNSGLFQDCEDDGNDVPKYAGSRYQLYHWFNSGTVILIVATYWGHGTYSGGFDGRIQDSTDNGSGLGSVLRHHFPQDSITE